MIDEIAWLPTARCSASTSVGDMCRRETAVGGERQSVPVSLTVSCASGLAETSAGFGSFLATRSPSVASTLATVPLAGSR